MRHYGNDTIAAIATAAGIGGIGIVRISGDKAFDILQAVFLSRKPTATIESHRMIYGTLVDGDGHAVDEAMACFMQKPKSYTREDVVEFHCHGGRQTIESVLRLALARGARLAEPGEFTKRAFLNGRIDLSQAEAVIDVINARTDLARQAAISQLRGSLSEACKAVSDDILTMLAHIEASIDYPEHEHEAMDKHVIWAKCDALTSQIDALINSANKGKILRDGIETAIIGEPNAGKSSLLNYLLDEDRAIVTDIPGTTRDVLRESISIHGIPIQLMDTAGIRQSSDTIEKIGIDKSMRAAADADLVVFMLDGAKPLSHDNAELLKSMRHKKMIVLINKTDLPQKTKPEDLSGIVDEKAVMPVSIKAKTGFERFYELLKEMFLDGHIQIHHETLVTNMRHKDALVRCADSIRRAMETAQAGLGEDFMSIDLQAAYYAIGEITGETLDEDIIDKIFQEFCLGK